MGKLRQLKQGYFEEIAADEQRSIKGGASYFWDSSIGQWLYCPGEVEVTAYYDSNDWYWGPGSALTPTADGSNYDPYYGYGGYYDNPFLTDAEPYYVSQIPADDYNNLGGVTIPISYFHQSYDVVNSGSDSAILSLPAGLTQYQVDLAWTILGNPNIRLATIHVDTQFDGASAFDNLMAIANGDLASTSPTGDAQGTLVALSYCMLNGIQTLGQCFTFSISELAGADHATNSGHYEGTCMDVNWVNGNHVDVDSMTEDQVEEFRKAAFAAGATVIYDPYHDPYGGHANHFHIEF